MQSVYYPFAEFRHCNPDAPDDPFPSRVCRYARSLAFLLNQSKSIEAETSDFFTAEELFLAWFRRQHSALAKVTGLRCTTVDAVLDEAETSSGWSIEGCPLLVGVSLQIEHVVNPNIPRARTILSKSSEIFAEKLGRPTLEITVYDTRNSERLSLSAIRNSTLMAALAAPMLSFDIQTLRSATAVEPSSTAQMEKRMQLVAEQRERSINTGIWMLASGNFGTYSMQQVRRTLLDVALSSNEDDETLAVIGTALHGSRSELIAFSERVAGPLS